MSEPHKVRFWQIEESVGPTNYFVRPGIFSCEENAKASFLFNDRCRAVEYQQGEGNRGPERVIARMPDPFGINR